MRPQGVGLEDHRHVAPFGRQLCDIPPGDADGAGSDWNMETLQVHFSGQLGSGQASPDDVDYIVARMKQCPVSRNLREIPDSEATVTLN